MARDKKGLHPTRDLRKQWRKGDAEKLAVMENEASGVWPGGGGWQTDPQELERWICQGDLIGAFATEDGDRIVALCTLMTKPGQKEHAYIPHLVCHPDYHGKKHGKSVLHAAVECGYDAGFTKVDLHTWSGNMKAVPLYKKTGFMWKPETTVFMENFTPAARRHPLGAAFFARHDWYDTLVRSVELKEDLVTRGKVRVYEYVWKADNGDFLRMVFDRQSWRLIEVENGELLAACTLPDEKLVAGMPHRARWRIVNKKPEPVQLFLGTIGEVGIEIAQRERLELEEKIEVETSFGIDPEIPEKKEEPRAALLRSELILDGEELELCAGIDVRQAVDISLEAVRSIVTCGRRKVRLTLRSNLEEKGVVELTVRPRENVEVPHRRHRLALAARRAAEVEVELQAATSGPLSIEVEANVRSGGRKIPVKRKRLDLLAVEVGRAAASVGENTAILYGGSLALFVSRRHGEADVHYLPGGLRAHRLHLPRPQLGPPFSWDDLFQEKGEARIERDEGGLCLHLCSGSVLHPGLVLERRMRLVQGPLVEVVDRITNGSERALELERLQGWGMGSRRGASARFCAPRPDGTYADSPMPGGRQLQDFRLPDRGEEWPEGWLCRQGEDGLASGVIWERAEVVEARNQGEMRQKAGRLGAGQALTMRPFYLFVGEGDWRTVRRWWQLLFGPGLVEEEGVQAEAKPPVELRLTPDPLVLSGEEAAARLSLRSPGNFLLNGEIVLKPEAGLRLDVKKVAVEGLDVDHPVEERVMVGRSRKKTGGAAGVELRFSTDEAVYRARSRALLLPREPAGVEVRREEGLIRVDNGLVAARVAAGFFGSVVSLVYRGEEFLNSSHPKGGQRGWRNPWHGGIHPAYDRLWGRLHRERFRARIVRRKGEQGLVWEGVRVGCEVEQEDARGHSLFFEYLLTPGVGLLAVVVGRRDRLGIWSEEDVGVQLWPAFADGPGRGHFHTAHVDRVVGRAAPHWSPEITWRWGGVVGKEGRCLFIGGSGEGAQAGGWAEGPEGCVLYGQLARPLPAGGCEQGLFFVAPALSLEEAQERESWGRFAELP